MQRTASGAPPARGRSDRDLFCIQLLLSETVWKRAQVRARNLEYSDLTFATDSREVLVHPGAAHDTGGLTRTESRLSSTVSVSKAVDLSNIEEYAGLLCEKRLVRNVREALDAMIYGMDEMLPRSDEASQGRRADAGLGLMQDLGELVKAMRRGAHAEERRALADEAGS